MKRKKLLILLLLLCYISCNNNNIFKKDNILMKDMKEFNTPFKTVPFDKLITKDYLPAFKKAIKEAGSEIDIIIKNPAKPAFANTIEALEHSLIKINYLSLIFFNINLAHTNKEIQDAAQIISPMLTEFSNDVNLNEELFKRVKEVYENKDKLNLSTEQQMLLRNTYKDFIRNGINLDSDDKAKFREVQEFAAGNGVDFEIQRWDWYYYSEKLKKQKYDINDEMLKPYFKLGNVKKGIFDLVNELYGISFRNNTEIPLYHPDVETYEVIDQAGNNLAILYLDFLPRESKLGGAWMTNYLEQYKINNEDIRPHVSLVFNFTKPTDATPSLLTYDEVQTFLHELGHGLHSILSDCRYWSLSGANVYRDFVELPSQIMENWAREKEWLNKIAIHYETGEIIPDDLLEKILQSKNFNTGYSFVRQLSFGLNDMAWHTIKEPVTGSIADFEKAARAPTELFPEVEGCIFSTAFKHIFSGGYAAGYYGYKWAEVLDADAFSVFKEKGIFDKETASSFRTNILAKGASEHPMELYKKFRGQEPVIEPLLERSGLKSE